MDQQVSSTLTPTRLLHAACLVADADRGIECIETILAAHYGLGMLKHALQEVPLLEEDRLALILEVGNF